MARLVVFGSGDIAKLAHYYFESDSAHEVVAFTVDAGFRENDEFRGLPLVDFETVEMAYPPSEYKFFVALAYARMNKFREEKVASARRRGYKLASYISSRCSWLTEEPHGDNLFILEDNTVQPFVSVGDNVTMWSGNHIGHDSVIENNVFISSHVVVSGRCRIERNSFLGVNATLRNGLTVAPETIVGAGAVIMKNTEDRGVYLPQRAELFKKRSDEIEL